MTEVFSESILRHIGYVEIAVGLGLSLGPTLGSLFYEVLDFEGTMVMFAILNLATLLLCYRLLPTSRQLPPDCEPVNSEAFGIWKVVGDSNCRWTLGIAFFGTFNIVFFQGFIATYLITLGLTDD